jgi:Ca2+-transporting ATPase
MYALGHSLALPATQLGALAFTALVAGNLGLIVLYRAGASLSTSLRKPNPAFWVVTLSALGVLTLVTRFELPAQWFGFAPPPPGPWLLALLTPFAVAAAMKAMQQSRP